MKLPITVIVGLSLLCANVYADNAQTATSKQTQSSVETGKIAGEAFLQANKTKPGIVTLPSGLQYKILVEGKGEKPSATDTVTVNYAGALIDGKEFDSSYKRGEPTTFAVNELIKGWIEALQLMPVGSTWELYVPASLAYGEKGSPPEIGPNETLVFKIELISIKK